MPENYCLTIYGLLGDKYKLIRTALKKGVQNKERENTVMVANNGRTLKYLEWVKAI
jgi:hypothetical protein